jgi:hypothetical protein
MGGARGRRKRIPFVSRAARTPALGRLRLFASLRRNDEFALARRVDVA